MISMEMLQDARRVLSPVINQTPVLHAPGLVPDCDFYLKADCLQKTGAFKLRGAYYKIATLSDEEKRRGVIACSAGNHAQGVGFASRDMKIPATICIPAGAPISKIQATRSYGANVVLVDGVYDDAYAEAVRLRDEQGLTFIHPFDDYRVMAGQGTIGLEILEQSDVMLVCGNRLSNGMRGEIAKAALLRMPITVFDEGLYLEVQKLVTQNNGNKKSVKLDRENFPMAFTEPESYLENAALFK